MHPLPSATIVRDDASSAGPDLADVHPDDARTPGEQFADAIAQSDSDDDVRVPMAVHLPGAFPLFSSRPRYAVRHLLKTTTVGSAPTTLYVHEPPRPAASQTAGTSYASTPEAQFAPRLEDAHLTDLEVALPLPAGLLEEPELLASFVDFRVLVRMSVVENETLLHGSADGAICGLTNLPEIGHHRTDSPLEHAVFEYAARAEETGGSCDGIVMHPTHSWELARTGALERLSKAGVTVSRTRMMAPGTLMLGDFSAALTLLITNDSELTLRRGTGPDASDEIAGRTSVGLAVHLPQHLMLLDLGGHHG
jgi:hypothetical protein